MATVKTAISLPEELFRSLVAIADKTGRSRSAIVAEALDDYANRREARELTKAYDEVYGAMGEAEHDEEIAWVRQASLTALRRVERDRDGARRADSNESPG
jgi:predicted transcriptional regulator